MEMVRTLLRQMIPNRLAPNCPKWNFNVLFALAFCSSQNLMDYVFSMLEQYANSLEQEVEERTKELVEEKRKRSAQI
jgi:C4-dicarboxylate-specific signal transduction histidine kinase